MNEHGIVKEITVKDITIEVTSIDECEKCCGCKASKTRNIIIDRREGEDLSIGDHVEVSLDPSIMLSFFSIMYGLPMVSFISTLLTVYYYSRSPIISFIAAMTATTLTYLAIGWFTKKTKKFSPNVRVI